MKRAIRRLRPRLRGRANDATFLAGCALIVGAFAVVAPAAGMFAGGAVLIGISILFERSDGRR